MFFGALTPRCGARGPSGDTHGGCPIWKPGGAKAGGSGPVPGHCVSGGGGATYGLPVKADHADDKSDPAAWMTEDTPSGVPLEGPATAVSTEVTLRFHRALVCSCSTCRSALTWSCESRMACCEYCCSPQFCHTSPLRLVRARAFGEAGRISRVCVVQPVISSP